MFSFDSELLHLANHTSYMFHATIGLDPFGNFSSIENLSYEMDPFRYAELGRNHAPVTLPFEGPGRPGELTLQWGMIVRSKLYEWMQDVDVGKDFRKHLYIFQLSQKRLPLRIYHLTGAFPISWKASDLTTEMPTTMASEEVVLAYEGIDMLNLSAIAMAGQLLPALFRNRTINKGEGTRWEPLDTSYTSEYGAVGTGWEPTEGTGGELLHEEVADILSEREIKSKKTDRGELFEAEFSEGEGGSTTDESAGDFLGEKEIGSKETDRGEQGELETSDGDGGTTTDESVGDLLGGPREVEDLPEFERYQGEIGDGTYAAEASEEIELAELEAFETTIGTWGEPLVYDDDPYVALVATWGFPRGE